jgi:CDP-diacylglycerol---serine O-phosphatidyltransferase
VDELDNANGQVNGPLRDEGSRPRRRRRLRRRELSDEQREHRRLRIRRHGRRAYIRSVYSLPSLATLGNAICGFASIWIATFDARIDIGTPDHWTRFLVENHFLASAYLIFIAMLFDALDGRLARFARHTTDFGGQLDSLADAISFGAAPAFLALQLFHAWNPDAPPIVSRIVWAAGALYFSCAIIRLARFNVSNEHGEQHHFSFLGLPSPGAASVVAAWVLMQQDLAESAERTGLVQHPNWQHLAAALVWCLPPLVLFSGLLMVSTIRYPHLVNRYLRGRRSIERLLGALIILLLLIVVHRYTLAIGTLLYAFMGPVGWGMARIRRRNAAASIAPPARATPPALH